MEDSNENQLGWRAATIEKEEVKRARLKHCSIPAERDLAAG